MSGNQAWPGAFSAPTGRRVAGVALLLAACLAGGCAGHLRSDPMAEAAALQPTAPPRQVRIVTVNVWSGLTYRGVLSVGHHPDDPEARYRQLVERLRAIGPDIIAVQEANPLPRYAERLAADLGYDAVWSVAIGGIRLGPVGIPWNLREGDAVLVRRPWVIADARRCPLGGSGIATNWLCCHFVEVTQALVCRLVVNGKRLYVCNVHLHAGESYGQAYEEALVRLGQRLPAGQVRQAMASADADVARRSLEIARLSKALDDVLPASSAAVLLGDFNTDPRSGEVQPLLGAGAWTDSFSQLNPGAEGTTWDPARNPNISKQEVEPGAYGELQALYDSYPHRLDLILLRGIAPARIVESRLVLTPEDGACPSDHYGVLTTIMW
jgi:endonuclease/exonuclease/phosphatase family metal-dependent hydrolase